MTDTQKGTPEAIIQALRASPQARDEFLRPLEHYTTELAALHDDRYSETYRRELREAAEIKAAAAVDAAAEQVLASIDADASEAGKKVEQAVDRWSTGVADTATEVMAAAGAEMHRARKATELSIDIELVRGLEDASTIAGMVQELMHAGDPSSVRRLGLMAEIRLTQLSRQERAANANQQGYVSPAEATLRRLREQLRAWNEKHPTIAQRLAAIESARVSRAGDARREHARTLRAMKLDRRSRLQAGWVQEPAAREDGPFVMGRAFSR